MSAVNCGNCEFAAGPNATAEQLARAETAGFGVPRLHCRRHPTPLPKRAADLCGEHSELIAARQRDFARLIAAELAAQPGAAGRVVS